MRNWLELPPFDDPEQARAAFLLNYVSLAVLGFVLLAVVGVLTTADLSQTTTAQLIQVLLIRVAPLVALPILAQFLMRQGQVRRASLLIVYGLGVIFSLLIIFNGGVQSNTFANAIVLILAAGLLLTMRHAFFIAGVIILIGGVSLVLEAQGGLPLPVAPLPPFANWVSTSIVFIVTTIFLHLFLRNMRHALDDADAARHELQGVTQLLEAKVAERTHEIEAARAEAERARQATDAARALVEQQAWLATGLAQLGEKLRGEQPLPRLAENIIQHLCQYGGGQLGALFVRQGEQLRLLGSYAYTQRHQAKNGFGLGDGLVGQAALEKEMIILTQPPADYLLVMDGLVTAVPATIILLPFLYENQLIGVAEIAFLHEPSEEQIEFLKSTREGIAIAFSVSQARLSQQREHTQ